MVEGRTWLGVTTLENAVVVKFSLTTETKKQMKWLMAEHGSEWLVALLILEWPLQQT